MSAFRSGIFTTGLTDRIGFGVTLDASGAITSEDGPTLERVTAAPTATRNAGSLALRTNGTLYITTGGGTWFSLGGGGAGWNLPDDVAGIWGTAAPGQVSSTYVSASNRWDLSGDAINQATAASGAALRIETGSNTITGAVAGNASGAIEVRTGITDSNNAGATGGNSGALTLQTGNAGSTLGTSGSTGAISLTTGNSDDANSGNINLTTGTAAGTRGTIEMSARLVHVNDDVPFSVGTAVNDRFQFSYNSGTPGGQLVGTAITAGGATQATRAFGLNTGNRTKNDNDAGTPGSGQLAFSTGQAIISFAAGGVTGGNSGGIQIVTGATDSQLGANTGGNTGAISMTTGNALSTLGTSGNSGAVTVGSGTSADGNTGNVVVQTGAADGAGGAVTSGAVSLTSGAVGGTGTTGAITLTTGTAAGAGISGSITFAVGGTTGGTPGVVKVGGTAPVAFLENGAYSALADADATLTAAQHRGTLVSVAAGANNRTITTLTAAQLVAAFPSVQVGSVLKLRMINLKAANTVTLAGGAGVTAPAGVNLVTVAQAATEYALLFTNVTGGAEAVSILRTAG